MTDDGQNDRVIVFKNRVNDLTYAEVTALSKIMRTTSQAYISWCAKNAIGRDIETASAFTTHRHAQTRRGFFKVVGE